MSKYIELRGAGESFHEVIARTDTAGFRKAIAISGKTVYNKKGLL
ncbi:hypothetical protein [uncultured Mitsuokella sp.]|nr:hypothetical protein [uncultured Mitsuokella sp.]